MRKVVSRATLVAVCLLAASMAPLATAATSLVTEISNAAADEATWMEEFDSRTFAVGDFDGDGVQEIVSQNYNLRLYVLRSDRPDVLAELTMPYPAGFRPDPHNDPSVADVDGDGALDIVAPNGAAYVCRWEYVGGTSGAFDFEQRWCKRANQYDAGAAMDGGAWVEDVDGDGKMEIFVQTETRGYFAYRHDGTLLWAKDKTGGNAGPLVADLENDGTKEAIFFGDGGEVRVLNAKTGSERCSFFASRYVWPASIPTAGSAGDLDGDGKKEIVFIARDAEDEVDLQANDFMMFALRNDCSQKWRVQPDWGQPMSTTHPVIVDVDGDGDREIVGSDWNTMGHKPGNWEQLGSNNVFAFDKNGVLIWRTKVDNTWSNDDVAVANVDGDGDLEVLAIGRSSGSQGVFYLNARTGAKETHVATGSWTALKGPVAADLDDDGDTDWFLSVHTGSKGGGFRVYRTDGACRIPFGSWQIKNACDPPGGSGGGSEPPPPPPPTGAFDATFSGVGGNEWWIETEVDVTGGTLGGVDARVNGGAWQALELKSWGDWARSLHAPDGAEVQFRARSTAGEEDLSGCYRWTSATAITCGSSPGPDPGPGSFDATFRNARGNTWWVEVDVDANEPLAGVDARVNGGAWVALEKKSWGSWAKSMQVPDGATVEFRARSTSGATDTSSPYTWPP